MAAQTLRVSWRWTFETPMHCGAGISRPGVADALVLRDPRGPDDQRDLDRPPWLTGDGVKGALRMSAEQIAAWLGAPQQYDKSRDPAPAEPKSAPFAALFGGGALAHFAMPERVTTGRTKPHVFASTKIDRRRGAAESETLREVETVVGPEAFENNVSVALPDSRDGVDAATMEREREAVITLLLAAVAGAETIGAKAGIGWGRVRIGAFSAQLDGAPIDTASALAPARLEVLKEQLRTEAPPFAAWLAVPSTSSGGTQYRWHRLEIELHEPTCLTSQSEIVNHLKTDRLVAPTTLRGALANLWRREGVNPPAFIARLGRESRWSPGFPVTDGRWFAPAPLSFLGAKRSAPGESGPVIDALRGERAVDRNGQPFPTKALTGFVALDDQRLTIFPSAVTEARMHVHREWLTGGKRRGALFSRERLIPDRIQFTAWAYVPVGSLPDRIEGVALGKRTSSGSGLAAVSVVQRDPDLHEVPDDQLREEFETVIVQLLSPAIVRSEHGYARRSVSPGDWVTWAGLAESVLASDTTDDRGQTQRATDSRRGGWMTTWGHPRAPVTAVQAGSTWRIRCRTREDANALRSALRKKRQIGERRHEGYGWFAVEPEWIRNKPAPEAPHTNVVKRPESRYTADDWPGMPSELRPRALELVAALKSIGSIDRDILGPLHELARRASTITDAAGCERLRAFCDHRADRERPGAWKDLKAGAVRQKVLDGTWNRDKAHPALLRFALLAAITRTMEKKER